MPMAGSIFDVILICRFVLAGAFEVGIVLIAGSLLICGSLIAGSMFDVTYL